jgi:hypothetical protein
MRFFSKVSRNSPPPISIAALRRLRSPALKSTPAVHAWHRSAETRVHHRDLAEALKDPDHGGSRGHSGHLSKFSPHSGPAHCRLPEGAPASKIAWAHFTLHGHRRLSSASTSSRKPGECSRVAAAAPRTSHHDSRPLAQPGAAQCFHRASGRLRGCTKAASKAGRSPTRTRSRPARRGLPRP